MKKLAATSCLILTVFMPMASFQKSALTQRAVAPSPAVPSSQAESATSPTPVPVIVELFTSEGCSSCPPADALLMQLESEQSIPGAQVIALEEHVDYWNSQGWVDPFSSSELTLRQQRYAEFFRHGSSYTPQMVVDGQWEFVGSRPEQAKNTIAAAASLVSSKVTVTGGQLDPHGHGEFTVTVNRLVPAPGDTAEVWFAVTETRLHSQVARGENAGRDLGHAAVVRELTKLGAADTRKDPPFSSTAKFKMRPEWNPQNLRAVVFVQEKKSRHILGAATAKVVQ